MPLHVHAHAKIPAIYLSSRYFGADISQFFLEILVNQCPGNFMSIIFCYYLLVVFGMWCLKLFTYYLIEKSTNCLYIFLVVCDANLKIMDIVTRWRGSVHDSRIFRECLLKQRFEAGAFYGISFGDSGNPCTPYLFTPVLNPHTEAEERYNRSHIRTRNTIERCFGVWKQRLRCLLRGMFGEIGIDSAMCCAAQTCYRYGRHISWGRS